MTTRQARLDAFLHMGECPTSYIRNMPSEDRLLSFIDEFWSVYHSYHPDRKPLLLAPINECGQRKMICTFVRPTLLKYDELHDVETCSKYIAGYIQYEPLCSSEHYQNGGDCTVEILPSQIVSPSTVLDWQVGNCFEMSLLLTSLLIGAGYRAYTVVGHAHQRTCLNDQSKSNWPGDLPVEVNSDDEEAKEEPIDEEYGALLAQPPTLREPTGVNLSNVLDMSCVDSSSSSSDDIISVVKSNTGAQMNPSNHPITGENNAAFKISGSDRTSAQEEVNPVEDIKPIHSWVMLLPGGRKNVKEAVFIEPAVGELLPIHSADVYYTGIESVFDDKHYYVNLHPDALVSGVITNLSNNLQWENVLLTTEKASDDNDAAPCLGNMNNYAAAAGASVGSATGGASSMGNTTAFPIPSSARRGAGDLLNTPSNATGGITRSTNATAAVESAMRTRAEVPLSWVSEPMLTHAQYETRYANGGHKTIEYANAIVRLYSDYSQSDLRVREVVLTRPQQSSSTNAVGSIPGSQSERSTEAQMHIFYKHRGDKLRRRSIYNSSKSCPSSSTAAAATQSQQVVHEWYDQCHIRDKGAAGLRELIHEPGVHRTMKFYWRSREDGLCRRVEIFYDDHSLRKVKEYYRGRDDRLRYRSATFARPESVVDAGMHRAAVDPVSTCTKGMVATSASSSSPALAANTPFTTITNSMTSNGSSQVYPGNHLDPVRMSEQFDRDASVDASKDVAKITFTRHRSSNNIDVTGEMWVFFHFDKDTVIRPYHVFAKSSSKVEEYIAAAVTKRPIESVVRVVTLPGSTPPSDLELFHERKWLHRKEKDCLAVVHDHMDECVSILWAMSQEESTVSKVLSPYDTLRNHSNESEAERAVRLAEARHKEESKQDYLAPFIANLGRALPANFDGDYTRAELTQEQARQVRDEALHDLKERLIQHGNIMQEHLDREKEELSRRQQLIQKSSESAVVSGTTEHNDLAQYCEDASWRIKVLEERLARHINQASEKYEDLARRLSEDSRLSKLYTEQSNTKDAN